MLGYAYPYALYDAEIITVKKKKNEYKIYDIFLLHIIMEYIYMVIIFIDQYVFYVVTKIDQ